MRISQLSSFLASLALGSLASAQGQVHVVDFAAGPGAEFQDIDDAMAVAEAGDVVLVRSGVYGSLFDLPAHLVAEEGADVRAGQLLTSDLGPQSSRLVQGIRFLGVGRPVAIGELAAPIWLERCELLPLKFTGADWFLASACDSVVLSRCLVHSGPFDSRTAELVGSRVHAHESEFRSADGTFGGDALRVRAGSSVELFGTSVLASGGDAVRVLGASHLVQLDANIVGDLFVEAGSTSTALPGSARSLAIDSPVREGQSLHATIGGKPGDQVWLRYAEAPGLGRGLAALDGQFLLGSSSLALVATIPPSGVLDLTVVAPDLPEGWESSVFWCQAVLRDVDTHRFVVSSPSALVLLDETL